MSKQVILYLLFISFIYAMKVPILESQPKSDIDDVFIKELNSLKDQYKDEKEYAKHVIKSILEKIKSEIKSMNITDIHSPRKNEILDYKEWIESQGYNFEEYTYKTADGYINSVWRIPSKQGQLYPNKKPLILFHGILDCSWTFFQQKNPKNSLGFYFVDRGFDCWFPNNRGNTMSYQHETLDSFDLFGKYWDFSLEDLGEYDVPAIISFVKNFTKVDKVDYLGHSQGTTQFILSYMHNKQFMDENVDHFVAMAAVPNLKYINNSYITYFCQFQKEIIDYYPIGNFLVLPELIHEIVYKFAEKVPSIFQIILDAVAGNHPSGKAFYKDATRWFYYTPGGTSKKNMLYWIQTIKRKKLSKYDYEWEENLRRYGTIEPPDYDTDNIRKWNIKIFLPILDNDGFAHIDDLKEFYNLIEDKSLVYKIDLPEYNHVDVLIANDAVYELYPFVEDFLNNY